MAAIQVACPVCRKQLARSDSVRRHVASFHPNHMMALYGERASVSSSDVEVEEDRESETPEKRNTDCKYFYPFAEQTRSNTFEKWQKTFKKVKREDNLSEKAASELADDLMDLPQKREFFDIYKDYLVKALYLRRSSLHKKVLRYAVTLHEQDVPAKVAVNTAIRKYGDDFEVCDYILHATDNGDSEEEDEPESTDDESTDESTDELTPGESSDSEDDVPRKRRKIDF